MAHEAIFLKVAQGTDREAKADGLLVRCKNSLKPTFQSESPSLGIGNLFFFFKVCFLLKIGSVFNTQPSVCIWCVRFVVCMQQNTHMQGVDDAAVVADFFARTSLMRLGNLSLMC